MSDIQRLEMDAKDEGLGKIEIAPEVIEVIASIAASEMDGVFSMQGTFAGGVAERLGKRNHGKGVKVELGDEGIIIDLYLTMQFGVSIPDVSEKLQTHIRQTLMTMTALTIHEINIHIVGIQF
ncbi:Asp23/Gls24 family envelope stress response protein [Aureibacillus halotolerans]|uniref:Putative alkaline shock family protein YloU n=1 Tax=Aureibacillus halotolerans TaxID=1508390 RepID=A0A4R6U7A3_9BACI|nr:Asp23/Gls24 family envelope stress response protein [Aureibacillus halotolerans]TDQ41646.1 putative alkaline shock family protein YloU [Aureibacillus halotolerans]